MENDPQNHVSRRFRQKSETEKKIFVECRNKTGNQGKAKVKAYKSTEISNYSLGDFPLTKCRCFWYDNYIRYTFMIRLYNLLYSPLHLGTISARKQFLKETGGLC